MIVRSVFRPAIDPGSDPDLGRRSRNPLLRAAILIAPLLFDVTSVAAGETAEADWLARYQVVFARTAAGVPSASVEASIRWLGAADSPPDSLTVEMADDGFPQGYGAFVRDFEGVAPQGAPAAGSSVAVKAISIPAGRYRLPVDADGVAGFRYTVVMEHDPSDWGPGPDEAPYRFDGGAFWTGRALFITAPESRVEVAVRGPEGERISVSYEPIPGREGFYSIATGTRLRNSFLVVGRHREERLTVGETVVTLVLGEELADFMPGFRRSVLRFMKASSEIFGGSPPERSLIAGNLGAPPGSLFGGTFANDVSFLVDEPLSTANAHRWRPFLVHEIFHLWNGNAIRFDDRQQYWFSEGATEYYGHLLPVRSGEETAERFLETMRGKAAAYSGAAGSMGLLEAGDEKFLNYALVYQGGALAALVLDLRIRSASANRASLDDVMQSLYGLARQRGGRDVTLEEIVAAVSKVAGRPQDVFFERYIEGSEMLPLAESLALAGIEMEVEIAELPDLNAIVGGLLPVSSLTAIPGGLEVKRSETPAILPGDVIKEVEGQPVRTFEDLRWALRDSGAGESCEVLLLRKGREVARIVDLRGKQGDELSRSRVASVTLSLARDPDPPALEIRESLLRGGGKDGGPPPPPSSGKGSIE